MESDGISNLDYIKNISAASIEMNNAPGSEYNWLIYIMILLGLGQLL